MSESIGELIAILDDQVFPFSAQVQCIYCKEICGERSGFAEPGKVTSGLCPTCHDTHPDCADLRAYKAGMSMHYYAE